MPNQLRGRLLLSGKSSDTGDPIATLPWAALDEAHYPQGMSVGPGVIRLTLPLRTSKRDKERIRQQILVAFVRDFPYHEPISVRFPDGRYGDHRFVDLENPNIDIQPADLATHAIQNWQVIGKDFEPGFYLGSELPPEYIVLDVCNVPRANYTQVAKELQNVISDSFPEQEQYPVTVLDVWAVEEQFMEGHWTYANRLRTLLKVANGTSTYAADAWPGWIYWTELMTLFELEFRNRFDYCRFCRHERQTLDVRHTTAQCMYTVCSSCHQAGHIARSCPKKKPDNSNNRKEIAATSEERAFPNGIPEYQGENDMDTGDSEANAEPTAQERESGNQNAASPVQQRELSDAERMPPPLPPSSQNPDPRGENPVVSGTVHARTPSDSEEQESSRARKESAATRSATDAGDFITRNGAAPANASNGGSTPSSSQPSLIPLAG
ncbi:hypothetical protein NDA16_001161 [Ustilago loliicola]|nr:hypothetical protein NDA16_001161 [Ustilago loliicola]